MSAAFGRDWWPEGTRAPVARLAAGLLLAPLILAALTTALAFGVAGSALPDALSVRAATWNAGLAAFSALPAFSLSFGLAVMLLLWTLRKRGALAFSLAGALAGALFAAFTAAAFAAPLPPAAPVVLAVLGAANLLLARWIAGVGRRRPEAAAQ